MATQPPNPKRGLNRWGSTTYFDRWLFTRSTRYCPACLTGEDSELGRTLGGPWRRTWRLPVMFACTEHRRYLDHQCPACHHPVHLRHGGGHPQWGTTSLHPTQCRFAGGIGAREAERAACAAWLSAPRHPAGKPASTMSVAMLDLQHRIHAALDPQRPDRVDVLGRETVARHYFVDLKMMAYLVRVSWPLGRDFAATPAVADALDEHLADLNAQFQATVRNPKSKGYSQSVQHFLKSPPFGRPRLRQAVGHRRPPPTPSRLAPGPERRTAAPAGPRRPPSGQSCLEPDFPVRTPGLLGGDAPGGRPGAPELHQRSPISRPARAHPPHPVRSRAHRPVPATRLV
ncbi:TniQ family protein [Amycolatopsis sulphurea]|uniref:TniQ family protein n=1 Tax=Amycolatopsis sulphurea TaxID=76022 RepID=UPI000BF82789